MFDSGKLCDYHREHFRGAVASRDAGRIDQDEMMREFIFIKEDARRCQFCQLPRV